MTCIRIRGSSTRRRGFVCTDGGPLVDLNPNCPNAAEHVRQPTGYVAASVWAEEMLATHDPRECGGCGKWLIWVPKSAGLPRKEPDAR